MKKVSNAAFKLENNLAFFREPAYSDKPISKTRLIYTIILILGTAACFIVVFIYKSQNRDLVVSTVIKPTYKAYVPLFNSYGDNLDCTATKAAYFVDFSTLGDPPTDDNSNACYGDSQITADTFLISACITGGYGTWLKLYDSKVPKGDLLSADDLDDWVGDITVQFPDDASTIQGSTLDSVARILLNAVNSNYISSPDAGVGMAAYQTLISDAVSPYSTQNLVFNNLTTNYVDAFYFGAGDVWDNVNTTYELYYNGSKVSQCTYLSEEGWFTVFSYALNITLSLFSVTIVAIGIIYSMTKLIQHFCHRHDEEVKDEELKESAADKRASNIESGKEMEEPSKTTDESKD